MTQPIPYSRSFSYTGFSTSYPGLQLPGDTLDAEFDALVATLSGVLANLARLQRDDGRLFNQIVTLDALAPDVLLALGAGAIWLPRGAWAAGRTYAVSDVISNGTASYVCCTAHTSAALFTTDTAAGRWIKLFDSAGSIPADNSVSTVKIVDGAVTTSKIGFTALDLSGVIRGQGGVRAGSATAGLMRAKLAAGDVLIQAERATDDQGGVGFQIIGTATTWGLVQPSELTTLAVTRNGNVVAHFDDKGFNVAGACRATLGTHPTAGKGVALGYVGNVTYVTSYDYDTAAWLDLKARAKTITLQASGVDVLAVTSTGVDVTGTMKRGGVELGYLDIPANPQDGAYTLTAADRGKRVYSKNIAGQAITIPALATGTPPVDSAIVIRNRGTNPITLTPAGGVSLRMAGSATVGARAIAANGLATLIHEEADNWVVSGTGVS